MFSNQNFKLGRHLENELSKEFKEYYIKSASFNKKTHILKIKVQIGKNRLIYFFKNGILHKIYNRGNHVDITFSSENGKKYIIVESYSMLINAKCLTNNSYIGTIDRHNGDIYEGEFNALLVARGFGKMTYHTGVTYEGYWRHDKKYGFGTEIYPKGDKYEGNWINDSKSGTLFLYEIV